MSTTHINGTVLKRFQQDAILNGKSVLHTCLSELEKVRGTKGYATNKRLIISDIGAILFEAPTGTGKTLMAGHVVEGISQLHQSTNMPKVIWFWFAPFAGLIEQARRTIRAEFKGLQPKNPATDRSIIDLNSGDVFVTTWASVAVANESSRKVRTGTEVLPSIDSLVAYARDKGFAIGVVIDEAHHTFKGQSQAFAFYRDVLSPELTILVTATPKDKDIEAFTKATGIKNLRRITVSRQQAIDDRLIKEGVKVAVFKVPADVQSLIDFKKTALKQGVAVHNRLKLELAAAGLNVTPLMLVQVDSEPESVEQATQWLKEMGFRTDGDKSLIRAHTANEPDPFLDTIASDESVEALIFKMAVATGFDAPRAFTLVSFRVSRDEDFGVQIVGRILRVDRRLQVVQNLPKSLEFGYVFLSHSDGQTGLTSAASRINSVKTELASVTSNVVVVAVGSEEPHAQRTKNGQSSFLNPEINSVDYHANDFSGQIAGSGDSQSDCFELEEAGANKQSSGTTGSPTLQDALFADWGLEEAPSPPDEKPQLSEKAPNSSLYSYALKTDLGAPIAFKRALLSLESTDIVKEIVSRFRFDDELLLVAQQNAAKIQMEEVEIFGHRKDRVEEIRADLAQKEIDIRAQQALFKADDYDVIDIRSLHESLLIQFKKELERKGIDHVFDTDEKSRSGLHKILALRPQQLKRAISEAVAQYTVSEYAEALPTVISSMESLDASRLNLYGVYPDDLNGWERPFAEYLDNDPTDMVKWWHRNPPRKPYSVSMPLPGQPDFYPDFVVGISGRTRGNGILLIETKRVINDQERNALIKAQAEHPDYAKVMMIYWEDKREWQIVEYDSRKDSNYLDRVLRPELLATY